MLDLFEIIKALMHRPHLLLPLGLGVGSTELQILEVIKKADADNSGSVEKHELMDFLMKNILPVTLGNILGSQALLSGRALGERRIKRA